MCHEGHIGTGATKGVAQSFRHVLAGQADLILGECPRQPSSGKFSLPPKTWRFAAGHAFGVARKKPLPKFGIRGSASDAPMNRVAGFLAARNVYQDDGNSGCHIAVTTAKVAVLLDQNQLASVRIGG